MIDEKMAESNNSLGSIASISKNEGYGEKRKKKKTRAKKKKEQAMFGVESEMAERTLESGRMK